MNKEILDVIVIGGGYAGLASSYNLKKHGLTHTVFERGEIGESWKSGRWDSFKFNTANKLNLLPGEVLENKDPDGFASALEYVSSLKAYMKIHELPVLENSVVTLLEKQEDHFILNVSSDQLIKHYYCKQVIIASGSANEISTPSIAKNIPTGVKQLHTAEYCSTDQLPDGSVLVVGSAQSGCQIAEDLVDAGRKVYLSTSMVARIPRWYRGRDCMDWLIDMKFFEAKAEQIEDPVMLQMKAPHLTGTGNGRKTLSLQSLAKKGVILVGKMENADKDNVYFELNGPKHVKFADDFSKKVKEMIDGFIIRNNLSAPPASTDLDDLPDDSNAASSLLSLNLKEKNITTIIWSTGFSADFSYIKIPVFDNQGNLRHKDGLPFIPGLYFIGFPWLRSRKSTILFGIKDDAEFICDKVYENSVTRVHAKPVQ